MVDKNKTKIVDDFIISKDLFTYLFEGRGRERVKEEEIIPHLPSGWHRQGLARSKAGAKKPIRSPTWVLRLASSASLGTSATGRMGSRAAGTGTSIQTWVANVSGGSKCWATTLTLGNFLNSVEEEWAFG